MGQDRSGTPSPECARTRSPHQLPADALGEAGIEPRDAEHLLCGLAVNALEPAKTTGLSEALTGPVQRGDTTAVQIHLDALRPFPDARRLYRESSRATVRLARRAGRTPEEDLQRIDSLLDAD